jgi:hypothetical protein
MVENVIDSIAHKLLKIRQMSLICLIAAHFANEPVLS